MRSINTMKALTERFDIRPVAEGGGPGGAVPPTRK